MQSISAFLNIAKFADFRRKNADVSRTQGGVSRDSYIFWTILPPPPQSVSTPKKGLTIANCLGEF